MIISIGPKEISKAVMSLRNGQLIGLPTETVYGLAADATQDKAVASIFEAKGRPQFNPLIIHSHSVEGLSEYTEFDERARLLAEKFWPGPLTLVLPKKSDSDLSLLVSAGLDTVAVRIPQHPLALKLLQAYGKPLAAPSANISGQVSPTTVQHVEDAFGNQLGCVLDGGPCQVGLESTILDLTTDKAVLLRPGGIPYEDLEALLGEIHHYEGTDIRSPGMMKSHYAPGLPVRLNALNAESGEAFLGFGSVEHATLNLSQSGNLVEAAANLFAMLRRLDQSKYSGIAISPIPTNNLGLAINDRIRRAAKA